MPAFSLSLSDSEITGERKVSGSAADLSKVLVGPQKNLISHYCSELVFSLLPQKGLNYFQYTAGPALNNPGRTGPGLTPSSVQEHITA